MVNLISDLNLARFTRQVYITSRHIPRMVTALALFGALHTTAAAQPFVQATPPLANLDQSSTQWADFDRDGDLDLLSVNTIYLNNGAGAFNALPVNGLTNNYHHANWGDYDLDGDMDVMLTGSYNDYETFTRIYTNLGGGNFTQLNTDFVPVESGHSAWVDYDNDGDPDIVMTGRYPVFYAPFIGPEYEMVTRLYANQGGGQFAEIPAPGFAQKENGPVTSADYDNDGDMDIFFAGTGHLYANLGKDKFTLVPATITAGGTGAWSDYDKDGDLDVLQQNAIFRNQGSGIFSPVTPNNFSGTAWGDYDNDGDADVLSGNRVFINLGNSSFSELMGSGLTGSGFSLWGDFNNDNKLDIVLTDYMGSASLFANQTTAVNTPPTAPVLAGATVNGNTVTLEWFNSIDTQTPAPALTYNVYIGTTLNSMQKMQAHATYPSGYRHMVGMGNVQQGTTFTIRDLPPGTYFWSVQAIDPSFGASYFLPAQSFTIGTAMPLITGFSPESGAVTTKVIIRGENFNNVTAVKFNGVNAAFRRLSSHQISAAVPAGATTGVISVTTATGTATSSTPFTVTPMPFEQVATLSALSGSAIAWGDYDNDGDLDFVRSGNGQTHLYKNQGSDQFIQVSPGVFPGIHHSALAWGDYDNDNDLDLLLTGSSGYYGGMLMAKIFTNTNGTFTELTWANLMGVFDGSADWADYDNDGDLDVLLTGCSDEGCYQASSRIYTNMGNGNFVHLTTAQIIEATHSDAAWGDYDNDGDMDFALVGDSGAYSGAFARIYTNNGDGTFTGSVHGLAGTNYGSVDWADYDNDGDLDLLLTGNTNDENYAPAVGVTYVYTNQGGTFTPLSTHLPGFYGSSAVWGDYNNDGYADILLSGYISYFAQGQNTVRKELKVFTNNRNGGFDELTTANLPGNWQGQVAWGDYDADHDLDILVSGAETGGIFKNKGIFKNTAPAVPSGLHMAQEANRVIFHWNAASDAQTPAAGLSYNFYLGTSPQGVQKVSPMADLATGYRRTPATGNAQQGTSLRIEQLVPGTYYWGVQAVDAAFEGSGFADGGSFTISTVPVPFDLQVLATNTTTASLAWDFFDRVERFAVRYRVQGSRTWVYRSSATKNIILKDLQADQVYEWQVKAIYTAEPLQESDYSVLSSFRTQRFPVCDVPFHLATRNVTNSQATVSWSSQAEGEMMYEIFYSTAGTEDWMVVRTRTKEKTLNDLASGQYYKWKVRAICNGQYLSDFATGGFFSTTGSYCNDTFLPQSSNIAQNSALLSWRAMPDAEKYVVVYRATGTEQWITRSSLTNTLRLTNLQPGTIYEWRVRTICGSGSMGAFTPIMSFSTLPAMTAHSGARTENAAMGIHGELVVYPNPSEEIITVEWSLDKTADPVHVYVYDALGQCVYEQLLNGINSTKLMMTVKGVYIVRVTDGRHTWVKRFVIK